MIRILHYIGLLELGGSQAFVMEIYRNIDRSKMQFDFVTFPRERGPIYDEILSLGGRIYESPKYNGLNHIQYVRWWKGFLEEHPEYLVIHGHVRSVASIYLSVVRAKRCFTILHSHSKSNGKGIEAMIKTILQLPVRHQADYYMACSDDAGKWLFGDKIIRGNRYRTVVNAINARRFMFDEKKRNKIRKQLGIDNNFVLGHVGRFIKAKNQEFLLDILLEIVKTEPATILLFVGDGDMLFDMRKKSREMGLEDKTIFTGGQTNTEDYYNAMDVFLFPSLWEGLGTATIEAQTSGLPCIVSDGVPKAIDIGAGLVQWLPLEKGAKAWAEKCLASSGQERHSCTEETIEAGYDIKDNVSWMYRFYIKAYNYAVKHR